jgi:hypothetical protein
MSVKRIEDICQLFCLNFSRISFFFPLRFPCTSLRVKKWGGRIREDERVDWRVLKKKGAEGEKNRNEGGGWAVVMCESEWWRWVCGKFKGIG